MLLCHACPSDSKTVFVFFFVPPYSKKSEKIWPVDFDSSKEEFHCTECNAKTLISLLCTVSKKSRKNAKNANFGTYMHFWQSFNFFKGILSQGPKLKTKTVLGPEGQASHHDT